MKKEIIIVLLLISVVIIAGCQLNNYTSDNAKKQVQPGDPSLDTSLDDNSTLDDLDVNLDESSV